MSQIPGSSASVSPSLLILLVNDSNHLTAACTSTFVRPAHMPRRSTYQKPDPVPPLLPLYTRTRPRFPSLSRDKDRRNCAGLERTVSIQGINSSASLVHLRHQHRRQPTPLYLLTPSLHPTHRPFLEMMTRVLLQGMLALSSATTAAAFV